MASLAKHISHKYAGFTAADFDDPLEFIARDHFRQRQVCADMRRIGGQGFVTFPEAQAIAIFLEGVMPLHHQDEELDLFPRLRKRIEGSSETGIEEVIDRLNADHRHSEEEAAKILGVMKSVERTQRLPIDAALAQTMTDYAASEHRHLAVENAIVLTIARRALTRRDRAAMSRSMKRRRGIEA